MLEYIGVCNQPPEGSLPMREMIRGLFAALVRFVVAGAAAERAGTPTVTLKQDGESATAMTGSLDIASMLTGTFTAKKK